MARAERDEVRELERRAASAKLRYDTEVVKATDLYTTPDAEHMPEFLSRWEAQRQNLLAAFLEYRAAVDAYLEAARRKTGI